MFFFGNSEGLVYDDNNKEFIRYILSRKHVAVFCETFKINTIFFPVKWKKLSNTASDSHLIVWLFNWCKYCLTVLHLVSILYKEQFC